MINQSHLQLKYNLPRTLKIVIFSLWLTFSSFHSLLSLSPFSLSLSFSHSFSVRQYLHKSILVCLVTLILFPLLVSIFILRQWLSPLLSFFFFFRLCKSCFLIAKTKYSNVPNTECSVWSCLVWFVLFVMTPFIYKTV